jgi:hypothetical protein
MPEAHAILGPSGSERWMGCPGSVDLCKGLPDIENDSAKEGTAGHEAFSLILQGKRPGKTATNGVPLTVALLALLEGPLAWVKAYVKARKAKLFSEIALQIGKPAFGIDPEFLWGTADVLLESQSELCVADLKLGYNEVEAQDNLQGLLYLIGAAYRTGWVHDHYRFVILQPRSPQPVKEATYTGAELAAWETKFKPLVLRAINGNSELHPSDKACQWCRAAAVCPKRHAEQVDLAKREFSDPMMMSLDDILMVLDKADRIEDFIAKCREHVKGLLAIDHKSVPGWKRVLGRSNRKWRDEKKALAAAKKVKGVDLDEIAPRSFISPAEADKVLGKEFTSKHAFVPDNGKIHLVPESDKRPALTADFQAEDLLT